MLFKKMVFSLYCVELFLFGFVVLSFLFGNEIIVVCFQKKKKKLGNLPFQRDKNIQTYNLELNPIRLSQLSISILVLPISI